METGKRYCSVTTVFFCEMTVLRDNKGVIRANLVSDVTCLVQSLIGLKWKRDSAYYKTVFQLNQGHLTEMETRNGYCPVTSAIFCEVAVLRGNKGVHLESSNGYGPNEAKKRH